MIRLLGFSLLAVTIAAQAEPKFATVETVAPFAGPMPTGVTVSREGRIFVNFPRWGDAVEFTVAELKDGKPVPYPDAVFNRLNKDRPADSLVSVQSVVVDPDDRLWLLDTGSTEFGPTLPGGPKLVGVDLKTNKVFKTIRFPREVVLETTYLNDTRFDLRRGKGGVAYITDSSLKGPNGLIIVDLATGKRLRPPSLVWMKWQAKTGPCRNSSNGCATTIAVACSAMPDAKRLTRIAHRRLRRHSGGLRHETLTAERLAAIRLRNEGAISDEVLHRLEHELDIEALRAGVGELRVSSGKRNRGNR